MFFTCMHTEWNKKTSKLLIGVCISNIRPIMEYGDVIWTGGNNGDLDKLDMAQTNAARVVTGATARCDTSTLMNDVALAYACI